ncbi:MAG: radical SAM protein [Elusimicrobiales bacterium]|nr:radical SAM protein [Elusimicrobiales bacterium]
MKKPFRRAFIEITNGCNLACGFCAASARPRRDMTVEEFRNAAGQAASLAEVISLHLLGEPLTHERFPEILDASSRLGLKLNLVTNGVLLDRRQALLFGAPCLRQISVSLHALACLPRPRREAALRSAAAFARAKPAGLIVGFRLRAAPGDAGARAMATELAEAFGKKAPGASGHLKLAENVFLNFGSLFAWPGGPGGAGKKACLGLRHHFGILSDGRVVPCCADFDGAMALGNVNEKPLAEILGGAAAGELKERLAGRLPMPAHCSSCGFAPP